MSAVSFRLFFRCTPSRLLKASSSRGNVKSFALLITVLLAVAVASIALIVMRLIIASSSSSTEILLEDSTKSVVNSIRDSIYTQLTEDPTSPYVSVLTSEYPRQCDVDGELTLFTEGQSWPLECGTFWTYDTSTQNQGAKITLPSSESYQLVVESSAYLDDYVFGVTDTYLMGGLQRPSAYSGSDLDFNSLNATSVEGNAYSTKAITPLVSSFSDLLLAAEEGWTIPPYTFPEGTPFEITYLGPEYVPLSESSPSIFPIRSNYPDPLLTASIEESLEAIKQISCGSNFESTNIVANSANYSSNTCILAGYSLTDISGNLIEVPSAAAVLIAQGPVANSFDLYYSADLSLPGEACGASCNLLEISDTLVDSADHPGVLSYWTKLGSFYYPYSGFAYSDFTTFIGLCGEAFLGEEILGVPSSCNNLSQSADVTFAVGTTAGSKNVFLNGPILEGSGHLSVLASGKFIIPFWASAPSTILEIQASLLSDSSSATVESFPSVSLESSDRAPSLFTLQGLLAGKNLQIDYEPSIHSGFGTLIESRRDSLLPIPTFEFILVDSLAYTNNIS